jgi:hypothetical protein
VLTNVEYVLWVLERYYPGISVSDSVFYTCKKCGAAVCKGGGGDTLKAHDQWHESLEQAQTVIRRLNQGSVL